VSARGGPRYARVLAAATRLSFGTREAAIRPHAVTRRSIASRVTDSRAAASSIAVSSWRKIGLSKQVCPARWTRSPTSSSVSLSSPLTMELASLTASANERRWGTRTVSRPSGSSGRSAYCHANVENEGLRGLSTDVAEPRSELLGVVKAKRSRPDDLRDGVPDCHAATAEELPQLGAVRERH
jgi:hypothetical protein